jgi:hypothetical protein
VSAAGREYRIAAADSCILVLDVELSATHPRPTRWRIAAGRSRVLTVSDRAAVAVLLLGDAEVARVLLDPAMRAGSADGVVVVRR